ncbi:MAG TPA: alpha/beta hydrolase [Spirochaetota bacterium]|nr:alpha/beta hydrolase [Spirochaetota bacterium]
MNPVIKTCLNVPLMIFLLVITSHAITGCTCGSNNQAQTLYDISYGADPRNRVDISLPAGRTLKTPVIILLHGGAWISGDKSDYNFLREYFSLRGFAVVSVNYRLARVTGKGFDDILEDISKVLILVTENSGSWVYSKDLVFIAGHSAGGHMALLYSFTRDPEGLIRGVVSFCGVTDLTDPDLKRAFDRMQIDDLKPGGRPFDLLEFMTGGSNEIKKVYSPLYVTGRVPVLLFTGKKDAIVPWQQSAALHNKMISEGFDSTLYIYPDMGHDITINYKKIMTVTEKWVRSRSGE